MCLSIGAIQNYMFRANFAFFGSHPIGNELYIMSNEAVLLLRVFQTEVSYINSLWPGDAKWWCVNGSILAQVLTCCLLAAPGHYLNQRLFTKFSSKTPRKSAEGNFIINSSSFY